jgi:hypothetical protein
MPLRDALKVTPPGLLAVVYRDPWMFVGAMSLWAALASVTLVAPGEIMPTSPLYSLIRGVLLTERQWGWLMLADAVCLFWTLWDKRLKVRLPVAFASGAFWFVWGGAQFISGVGNGITSGMALWNICAGLGLYLAVIQWVHREELT